jgi:hypothetical protein
MISAHDLETFQKCMMEHEEGLSEMLGIDSVNTHRFPDLPGAVKSLGAWGGDFVMIATETDKKDLSTYLYEKDIRIMYPFDELIYHGG